MRLRTNDRDDEAVPAWQTIYCSLILIMLVLFVMLVSYSVGDKRKMTNVKGHFDRYSGNKGELGKENYISSSFRNETIPAAVWIKDTQSAMRQAGINAGLEGAVATERAPGGVKFKMNSDVLFPSGQAIIRGTIYPYFDQMIKIAKEHELSLSIEGHTDNVPIHNDAFPSNWELSAARATNVLRYCLEKGEIPAGRLSAAGFGSYRPLVPNDTPQGRMQNRRIEVVLFKSRT
jgi:chemotaxis protein MotB